MKSLELLFRLIEAGVTIALVCFAYVTIREAKKDRRKNTLEKMLENLYSPLREILTRARFDNSYRNHIRQQPFKEGPRDYVFTFDEFKKIHEMIENFAHYLAADELLRLRRDLQKFDIPSPQQAGNRRFQNSDLDPHLKYVKDRCDQLREELHSLTGI